MSNYGKIVPRFWTGGSGAKLRGEHFNRLLAAYLFTAPTAHSSGIYYLALVSAAHELGGTVDEVREGMARLAELGIAEYDEADSLVWVPEMARVAIGESLEVKDKRRPFVTKDLLPYRKHRFYRAFLDRYGVTFKLGEAPSPDGPPLLPARATARPEAPSESQEAPSDDPASSKASSTIIEDHRPSSRIIDHHRGSSTSLSSPLLSYPQLSSAGDAREHARPADPPPPPSPRARRGKPEQLGADLLPAELSADEMRVVEAINRCDPLAAIVATPGRLARELVGKNPELDIELVVDSAGNYLLSERGRAELAKGKYVDGPAFLRNQVGMRKRDAREGQRSYLRRKPVDPANVDDEGRDLSHWKGTVAEPRRRPGEHKDQWPPS